MRLLLKLLKANQASFLTILFFIITPFIVSSSLIFLFYNYQTHFQDFQWTEWLLVYIIFAFSMTISLLPTTMTALIGGYFLGLKSLPLVVSAYLIASFFNYFLCKRIDNGSFQNSLQNEPRLAKIFQNLEQSHLTVVILARLSPILPFAAMNMILCTSGIQLRSFMTGSLIGMLPRTIFTVWLAHQSSQIFENHSINTYLHIASILVATVGLYWVINQSIQKAIKS